jgi:hypothetical protein
VHPQGRRSKATEDIVVAALLGGALFDDGQRAWHHGDERGNRASLGIQRRCWSRWNGTAGESCGKRANGIRNDARKETPHDGISG